MKLFLFPLLPLAACTMEEVSPPAAAHNACAADNAKTLIGRSATQEVGTEALSLSGARSLRWIGQGQAVTMDYREDRLNISLDAANRVERISCG